MPLKRLEQIWMRDVLGKTGFYKFLSPKEIEHLHEKMNVLSYEKGEKIIREGTPGGAFYILAHGKVGIMKEGEGGDSIPLAEIEGANFFGETSLLASAPRTTSVVALEDVKLFSIGRPDFCEIFMKNPQIKIILERRSKARSEDTKKKVYRETPARDELAEMDRGPAGVSFAGRILGTIKQFFVPLSPQGASSRKARTPDDSAAEEQVQKISTLLEKDRLDNWFTSRDE
jgi:CRP-like cAMP-binding protein